MCNNNIILIIWTFMTAVPSGQSSCKFMSSYYLTLATKYGQTCVYWVIVCYCKQLDFGHWLNIHIFNQ
jgi:hypothetical protein